ncbi:SRPBCC family protein [Massilia sp. W12]|uniref:SRPBCC family protein n=1 Tax=Massilia sp. W12 TaxID=3126507 RepID=UPI0030D0E121
MRIIVESKIGAPLDQVWQAYTTPHDIVQWNAASDDWHTTRAHVNLVVGGEFSSRMEAKDGSVGFDFAGVYTNIIPQQLLEYRFGERTASVEFHQTDDGVLVKVAFDPEDTFSLEQQQGGWQAILNNFKRYVESFE